MKRSTLAAVAALLVAPLAAAGAEMRMDVKAHRAASSADSPSSKAYAASMRRMMSGMDVKPTGRPDEDFVRMMMPHHQGAIDMAEVELRYGKDPALRKLAEGIVAAQEREIAEMKGWRDRNGR